MPTFTVPDNFTVSDAEFRESKLEQEKIYRDEGGRQADRTYLDPLGHARWDTDYVTMRMAGYSHQQALQEMRVRIREAWRPPLPATEPHVPPPAPQPGPPPPGPGPLPGTIADAVARVRAALGQVDREHPDLRLRNRKADNWIALRMAARIVGPEVAFIGKTDTMDGGGKFTPPEFTPFDATLRRDDGQLQTVRIVGLSMDALWHLPTQKQIKAIVNSTDGEIQDGGSGKPASYDSYEIAEINPQTGVRQYRWHNPPVPQF